MQLGYTIRVPMEVKFIYGHSCILGGSPADKQVLLKKVSVYTSPILIAKLDYLTSLNLAPTGSLEYTPRSHFREMILDF